jgi:K+ transporter
METKHHDHPPSIFGDIRLVFATILTDPGSSLAYGADALIAVTVILIQADYMIGMTATIIASSTVMFVYFIAILANNKMTRYHTHKVLGGGAFVSAHITSSKIRKHIRLKKAMEFLGKTGTASLLADFPATQAISIISGVEALYFIPVEDRLKYAFGFIVFLSFIQRYGLGNLARYMIWPVLLFYSTNLIINATGIQAILQNGWTPPTIPREGLKSHGSIAMIPVVLMSIANGATLITGVEVGYSSVNIPHHKGRTIRTSMWILYCIVLATYSMQIINFLGLGISYDPHIPIPIQIANHIGGDHLAAPFGVITAIMLLLAAQTAQTDFPLEALRASRMNFFPRGIGDTAWRKTKSAPVIGGQHGVYNPLTTLMLGALSLFILLFFPTSHDIESMYGLAVLAAMNISILSFLLRQLRTKKYSILTTVAFFIMAAMLLNIIYNKFFEGAWFIVVLMVIYMLIFLVSEAIYTIWREKLNVVPLEFGLWYPAFQNMPVDRSNLVLVSKFHPGVVHFLKHYIRGGKMPLVLHFITDVEDIPKEKPEWFEVIPVSDQVDTITAITNYVKKQRPNRVHLIPLMVRGFNPILKFYFANSINRLIYALSQHADLQVEYNRERIIITAEEIARRVCPKFISRFI